MPPVSSVRRTLLYEAGTPYFLEKCHDCRPARPRPIYLFEFSDVRANPFGIITNGTRVFEESRYSLEAPVAGLQRLRLVVAQHLKPCIRHDGTLLVVTHIFYNCFYHFYHEVVAKIYLLQNMLSGKARILMPDTL
jgi:hypothetical protein